MITASQNISFTELTLLGVQNSTKQKLSVRFDTSNVTIYINNAYKPPISWFLTDIAGEMVMLGQIADTSYTIDLTTLAKGAYSLRIAGEVHIIQNI